VCADFDLIDALSRPQIALSILQTKLGEGGDISFQVCFSVPLAIAPRC
jgi:hypothetical protein